MYSWWERTWRSHWGKQFGDSSKSSRENDRVKGKVAQLHLTLCNPMDYSRPEYWSGQPFPSPEDLPNPEIEPRSPTLQVDSLAAEPLGTEILVSKIGVIWPQAKESLQPSALKEIFSQNVWRECGSGDTLILSL